MIEGGFYIKARCIQESAIMHAPPHVREIWDWLLMRAMYVNGSKIERGQVLTSYDEIRNGLSWRVGYRTERYSKWDCEKAMKWLTKEQMITTMKTTRGLIITILNYSYYQDARNYESHKESHKKATRKPQPTDTIDKKEKKEEIDTIPFKGIIDCLNENAGTHFRYGIEKTEGFIKARWNEGFKLADFITVIEGRCAKWRDDPHMMQYLRPETLFGTKFESYLNAE